MKKTFPEIQNEVWNIFETAHFNVERSGPKWLGVMEKAFEVWKKLMGGEITDERAAQMAMIDCYREFLTAWGLDT